MRALSRTLVAPLGSSLNLKSILQSHLKQCILSTLEPDCQAASKSYLPEMFPLQEYEFSSGAEFSHNLLKLIGKSLNLPYTKQS